MTTIVSSIEELQREAAVIQDFLEITVSENPEEIVQRGNDLAVHIARTGKMCADAEYHRDFVMQGEAMKAMKSIAEGIGLPASTLNKTIDAACRETNYLVKWCDRLNRTATHQLEWCRSLVSKAKEELRLSGGISGKYQSN